MERVQRSRRLLAAGAAIVAAGWWSTALPQEAPRKVVMRFASDFTPPPHPAGMALKHFADRLPQVIPGSEARLYYAGALYTIPEAARRYLHNFTVINQTVGGFALLGLVLAAVGLYGVISNLVAQRTNEFGIRLALGARPANVLGLVLGTGVRLTLLGLVLGAIAGTGLIFLLRNSMPGIAGFDFVALSGVALTLLAVAIFACWWPARRATRVDPLTALRAE